MRALRKPQLDLRLDAAAPDAATRWHDRATIPYRGRNLCLRLDDGPAETTLEGDELHLPLPPGATPRQIQDRTEAWLREQAMRHLSTLVTEKFPPGRKAPALAERRGPLRLVLSFARGGHWIEATGDNTLRCHWRLIEQPDAVIARAVDRALALLPATQAMADLFAAEA